MTTTRIQEYEEITDTQLIEKEGINELPILELDDETRLSFVDANKYINSITNEDR